MGKRKKDALGRQFGTHSITFLVVQHYVRIDGLFIFESAMLKTSGGAAE